MLSEDQIKELSKSLDDERVKTIDKAGMSFKYLETYDIINEANRIFNYNWNYTITRLAEVARETNQNGNNVVTFSAIVKVRIYDSQRNCIEREDTGVGIGTAKNIGDAIENSSKSAVSDSLKRCFRTMGEMFGNNLYAKQTYSQPPLQQNQSANNMTQPQQQYNKTPNNQPPQIQQNNQPIQNNTNQQDFNSLQNHGIKVVQEGSNLIAMGDNLYNQRDLLKQKGFKFSPSTKQWWIPISNQQVA